MPRTASIAANRRSGAAVGAADVYWSRLIRGDTVTLEIDVPASADTDELSIEPYRVSHFFGWPLAKAEDRRPEPTCWEDVACHPA